jgi:SAM-dependent methyltransferase
MLRLGSIAAWSWAAQHHDLPWNHCGRCGHALARGGGGTRQWKKDRASSIWDVPGVRRQSGRVKDVSRYGGDPGLACGANRNNAQREDRRRQVKEQARAKARQLALEFVQRGDATGWFEELYTQAQGNEQAIHWADMEVNPNLVEWLDHRNIQGKGKLALVVGCGLGDDAEELARRGFEVVAFDIAPVAIAWCRKRFPQSPVEYVVADVLEPPSAWQGDFDFILEAYTLQVLPAAVRSKAIASIASLLTIEGTLLVICRGRSPEEPQGDLPWPLTTEELNLFTSAGLQQVQFEDYFDQEEPPKRRFWVEYLRA